MAWSVLLSMAKNSISARSSSEKRSWGLAVTCQRLMLCIKAWRNKAFSPHQFRISRSSFRRYLIVGRLVTRSWKGELRIRPPCPLSLTESGYKGRERLFNTELDLSLKAARKEYGNGAMRFDTSSSRRNYSRYVTIILSIQVILFQVVLYLLNEVMVSVTVMAGVG